ncbi:MAG: hypothetical protein OHK0026_10330 [Rhodocyclaceae bacterium]
MKMQVSACMDGELDDAACSRAIDALCRDPRLRQEWETWAVIGDALRGTDALPQDFTRKVMDRLADEPPIVAAPLRRRSRLHHLAMPVAASVAGAALVVWVAIGFAPNEPAQPTLASVPLAPAAALPAVREVADETAGAQAPMPPERLAYLLAHQGYSPNRNLQGVAQYLRVVSGTGAAQ